MERVRGAVGPGRSGGEGLGGGATLNRGFRLPTGFEIDAWRGALIALAGEDTMCFRAYERAVRVDKNTPLARAMLAAERFWTAVRDESLTVPVSAEFQRLAARNLEVAKRFVAPLLPVGQ